MGGAHKPSERGNHLGRLGACLVRGQQRFPQSLHSGVVVHLCFARAAGPQHRHRERVGLVLALVAQDEGLVGNGVQRWMRMNDATVGISRFLLIGGVAGGVPAQRKDWSTPPPPPFPG